MIADDSLFLLIKSLSQAEKRYFKVFAARHVIGEKNNYVQLFDAIDRQVKRGKYEEKKLIRLFKNKIAHFPSAKHYLFEIVLKSLRAFHEGELLYQQVSDRIFDIKLLMRRGLYKKGEKLLTSAKKMAIEIDNPRLILELLQLERRLVGFLAEKASSAFFQKIEQLEAHCIRQLNSDLLYQSKSDRIQILILKELILRDAKAKKELIGFTNDKLLKTAKQANSFTSKWNYFSILSGRAMLLDLPAESKENMKFLVELFERNPVMQKEYASDYIIMLSDYLNSCFLQYDFNEFPRVLEKMKNFNVESREDEFIIFNKGVFLEFVYLMITNKMEEAFQLVPYIKSGLEKFKDKLTKASELAFLSNISALYFLTQRWKEGLDWVNKIILHKTEKVRFDIQSAMRIMQLIMQYELKNFDLVDYLLRADLRYYRKHKRYFRFEQICIEMLTSLLKSPAKDDSKNLFIEFHKKLSDFHTSNKEFITGFFEVFCWVDSKIRGIPLRNSFMELQPILKR